MLLKMAVDQAMLPHDLSDCDDRLLILQKELSKCEEELQNEDLGRGIVEERKISALVSRFRTDSHPLRFLRLRIALLRAYFAKASRSEAAMQIVQQLLPSF